MPIPPAATRQRRRTRAGQPSSHQPRHYAPERETDDVHPGGLTENRIDRRHGLVGKLLGCVDALWELGIAETEQIRDQHLMLGSKRVDVPHPVCPATRRTMDKYDRRSVAPAPPHKGCAGDLDISSPSRFHLAVAHHRVSRMPPHDVRAEALSCPAPTKRQQVHNGSRLCKPVSVRACQRFRGSS